MTRKEALALSGRSETWLRNHECSWCGATLWMAHYRANASFPHQIAVSHVEPFPLESDLPDWEDLRGRAPGATGDLSSEAFVRELRDGWR